MGNMLKNNVKYTKQWQVEITDLELSLKRQTRLPFPWAKPQRKDKIAKVLTTYPEFWGETWFSLPQFLSVEKKLARKD